MSLKFSVRRGTVIGESKLSMNRLFRLMYHFVQGHEANETSKHTGIGGVKGDSIRDFYDLLNTC